MGYLMFYLAVVAACLLWTATFVAAAARTERAWLRRLLVNVGVILPPVALLPWVVLTGTLAFGIGLQTNWFGPTLTACLAAVVGGLWIARGGMSGAGGDRVASAWPVVGLAAMFVLAKAVSFGTLLFIDNAIAAHGRSLGVEAGQIMQSILPPTLTADDDAAALYLRVFAAVEGDATLAQPKSPVANPVTTDVSAADVTALLARHAATLDLLRRAADKPGCRFVRDWSRPTIGLLLPEVSTMRKSARLLALAARHEAASGDAAAAVRDIVRIHRMAGHAAAEPVLVCGLVGQAIDTLALQTLTDVLAGLGKQDLPLLDEVAVRDFLASPISYQRHFLGEEAFGLASLSDMTESWSAISWFRAISAGGNQPADDWILDSILVAPASLLYRCFLLPADEAGYRSLMHRYQSLIGHTGPNSDSFATTRTRVEEIEQDITQRRSGFFASLMAPALSGILRSQAKGQALHRAAELLVAATRERLATGSFPVTAADLVPGRLPALPRDPFTADTPLVSKRDASTWTVYSVGPNGKDDGGPPGDAPAGSGDAPSSDDAGLTLAIRQNR